MAAESDPEAWARRRVRVIFQGVGHAGHRYVAQIKAEGLVFEGRAEGKSQKNRKTEARAIDEAVRSYLDFVERSGPSPKTQKTQPKGIDPETGKPYEPMEIPVPKREDVEDALDRMIRAEPDRDD